MHEASSCTLVVPYALKCCVPLLLADLLTAMQVGT